MNKVTVIGGGAAGLMAAIAAAEGGAQVCLIEPNERLGKKVNITGKGRCNVTNDTDLPGLLANIPRNGKFLYSAFTRWGSGDTMAFFERLGVPLKVERGNRVFPVSDRAFDISAALERRLKALTEKRVLTDPLAFVQDRRLQLDYMQDKMTSAARTHWDREARRFAGTVAKLDALSPLKVLGRGYALAQTEDGTVLRSAAQTAAGERIRVRLAQGQLVCDVAETKEE